MGSDKDEKRAAKEAAKEAKKAAKKLERASETTEEKAARKAGKVFSSDEAPGKRRGERGQGQAEKSTAAAAAGGPGGEEVRHSLAETVIGRPLPPIPEGLAPDSVTLVLFYQYIEPLWSKTEHKRALGRVIGFGQQCEVTGRGRCAREGLNCTLTGTPDGVRAFCEALRGWDQAFSETDFKLTDGLRPKEKFKALTIQKTVEIVAYGLPEELAPSLHRNEAKHVPADEYHAMMQRSDTVIIDVRNKYESDIGRFQPPPGGAELIDPMMRNSHEFPKWLNAPETKKRLNGKKVMMYCTGGIRCERASALLTQLKQTCPDLQPQEIVMVRGGIERYMKTYPEGGFWKGKNYLFDKRHEQMPELKTDAALAGDVDSVCCVCKAACGVYRGEHKCSAFTCGSLCKVPVLVCPQCQERAEREPQALQCPLCEEGHHLRNQAMPDLAGQLKLLADRGLEAAPRKRRLEEREGGGGGGGDGGGPCAAGDGHGRALFKRRREGCEQRAAAPPSARLLLKRLPLTVSATQVRRALELVFEVAARPPARKGPCPCGSGKAFKLCCRAPPPGKAGKRKGAKSPAPPPTPAQLALRPQVLAVHWLTDRGTGRFFGSALVRMASAEAAAQAVQAAAAPVGAVRVPGRRGKGVRVKAVFAPAPPEGEAVWPPPGHHREQEWPPRQ
jgi:predicted sulfurtransferase